MESPISKNTRRPQALIRLPPQSLISQDEKGPLSYLVSTPKALRILLTLKLRDTRFQQLLAHWTCILLAIVGVGVSGFFLMPMVWAMSAFAPAISLFVLLLSIGTGDLFLRFALEDDRFFELATKNHALSIFGEDDQSLPQPP